MEYPFSNGWLISVGQVSSRSITLLQMTTFSSFIKPNNSLLSVPNVFSLRAHLRRTWGLFPHRGCCKECRSEQELGSVLPHWGSGCYFGWTPEVWPTDWLSDSSIGFLFIPPPHHSLLFETPSLIFCLLLCVLDFYHCAVGLINRTSDVI